MQKIIASIVCFGVFAFQAEKVSAAEITVLCAGAVKEVLDELIPTFEKGSTHTVRVTWSGSADIKKRMASGEEPFDIVISGAPDIDDYIKQGKLKAESRVDLMKVGVGVGVPPNRPRPDVSSPEALRAALLGANSIGYSTGASGAYILALLDRLGIADQVKGRLKQAPSGIAVGSLLASSEVDIGFQQISELLDYPGITYVGPLPRNLQNTTVYSAGAFVASKQPEAAKAFVSTITSPATEPLIKQKGMEPADVKL